MESVIVVAGGSGTRMGASTPKQFLLLNGKPILMHTIEQFYAYNPQISIVLVLPKNQFSNWESLCEEYCFKIKHTTVAGGDTRFFSVKNGLDSISSSGLVAIHDGVRPLVSQETISRCFTAAAQKGNAIPVIKPVESVRLQTDNNQSQSVNRDHVWLVQTPQVFSTELIKRCYQTPFSPLFTDDASVAEHNGIIINLVEGNRENIKITTPMDMAFACAIKI